MNAAADLNHVTVKLPSGETRELGTFWKERPVVLSFVRHLGCIFCRKEVTQLRKRLPEIRGKGAELVVVGTGTPAQAARFAKEYGGDFSRRGRSRPPIVPSRRIQARRVRHILSRRGAGSPRCGRVRPPPGRTQGDPIQLGGMFVITPDQRVLFEHMARNSADLADIDKALASLDNGAAAK
ncbi:MAG: AhpC/TSA family protein [Deltaproteobacteria bacterium]|nr:AhpC/TSA family protein [Deltaproteobacteria bacterium]